MNNVPYFDSRFYWIDDVGDQLGRAVGKMVDTEADERANGSPDLLRMAEVGEVLALVPLIYQGKGEMVMGDIDIEDFADDDEIIDW